MNEEQRFAFDTWGFFTVEDAIMPDQVAELKAAADEHGTELHSQRGMNGGFWSQAFVDLLDVPTISPLLDEIYGGAPSGGMPAFRIDHINVQTYSVFNKDLASGKIHGSNQRLTKPDWPDELHRIYFGRDPETGAFQNGLVAVAYELEDTVCNGGGFGCLAGSHKSHLPCPEAWRNLSKGVHPMITRVPARAGTAIVFTEALHHVTLPWTASSTRTTLFYKFTKQGEYWATPDTLFHPSDADGWQGVDERKRAILTLPPRDLIDRRAAGWGVVAPGRLGPLPHAHNALTPSRLPLDRSPDS